MSAYGGCIKKFSRGWGACLPVGREGFESPSATPKLRDWQQVVIGRFPCEQPPAVLTPNATLGHSNPSSSKKAPTKADAFLLAEPVGLEPLRTMLGLVLKA